MPPLNVRQSVSRVEDMLKRISYKPGWKINIAQHPMTDSIHVICIYEGYESEDAAFDPISLEPEQVSVARKKFAISIGKSYRKRQRFQYYRSFDSYHFETMAPEDIIRHIIGGTIKEAEMYEFDRWFKFDGQQVFPSKENV
jgi:hypothetical protein